MEPKPLVAVVWDRFFFPANRGAKNIRKDALVRQLFKVQNSHENSGENAILWWKFLGLIESSSMPESRQKSWALKAPIQLGLWATETQGRKREGSRSRRGLPQSNALFATGLMQKKKISKANKEKKMKAVQLRMWAFGSWKNREKAAWMLLEKKKRRQK